jgi:Uma2 family endonuclease
MNSNIHVPPKYTVADYQSWEGDWELIEGYPYAMASAKMNHQLVAGKIFGIIKDALKKNKCKECEVVYELDWVLSNDTVFKPDIMIICGDLKSDFLRYPPHLAIEVVSESTRLKDRNIKYRLYESAGVKYYLLVDPETKTIELFELINNKFTSKTDNLHFELTKGCRFKLTQAQIFS